MWMDQGRIFFPTTGSVLRIALVASTLTCSALPARAQTGAAMTSIESMTIATDNTFRGAGGVAFWTKADSVTRFDRLAITPLP